MKALPLVAALSVSLLTGCASQPQSLAGEAGPAGAPSEVAAVSASTAVPTSTAAATSAAVPASAATSSNPSPATSISSSPSGIRDTTPTTGPPGRIGGAAPTSRPTSGIRSTDWANVTLPDLGFMGFGEARFRNGTASSGANNCTMLPGGARPAYAEYLAEEPASAPVTEDALILVECGSDGRQQALVPVQLGFDQKTPHTVGVIPADRPTGPDNWMTFTSYTVERGVIVTSVRKTDGSRETRRYRFGGGNTWERF